MANDDTKSEPATEADRKRHGDKLGAATGAPLTSGDGENRPQATDSPKRQGDPLEKVVRGGKA